MTEDFEQPKRSKEFQEGFRAYKEGYQRSENPHVLDNHERHKDWDSGFEEAQTQSSF